MNSFLFIPKCATQRSEQGRAVDKSHDEMNNNNVRYKLCDMGDAAHVNQFTQRFKSDIDEFIGKQHNYNGAVRVYITLFIRQGVRELIKQDATNS